MVSAVLPNFAPALSSAVWRLSRACPAPSAAPPAPPEMAAMYGLLLSAFRPLSQSAGPASAASSIKRLATSASATTTPAAASTSGGTAAAAGASPAPTGQGSTAGAAAGAAASSGTPARSPLSGDEAELLDAVTSSGPDDGDNDDDADDDDGDVDDDDVDLDNLEDDPELAAYLQVGGSKERVTRRGEAGADTGAVSRGTTFYGCFPRARAIKPT